VISFNQYYQFAGYNFQKDIPDTEVPACDLVQSVLKGRGKSTFARAMERPVVVEASSFSRRDTHAAPRSWSGHHQGGSGERG
jgi:hypothetical protein